MSARESAEQNWVKRIDLNGKVTGVFADYHYVGTGDIGGATHESTIKLLEAIVDKSETVLPSPPRPFFGQGTGPTSEATGPESRLAKGRCMLSMATADQMFNDIKPGDGSHACLPTRAIWSLSIILLVRLTSQAYHKRWILKNELLADAAEKASIAAEWMGGRTYPQQRLNDAWTLELGGHFHDTGAGTATPRTYQFAWNDDIIAANQFAGVLTSATEAIASGLNTQTQGNTDRRLQPSEYCT